MATFRVFFDKVVFFPYRKYIKNYGKNTTFTKKSWILQTKTAPFFFFSNAEKMEFYITVR